MKITIFGAGYVGLVTAACMADVGNHVVCVDVDPKRIDLLQNGGCPIFEPGLAPIIQKNLASGRLQFSLESASAVATADAIYIAVGTPGDEDGSADLSYVLAVANTIGEQLQQYAIIIDKSTVPVGTADKVKATITAALQQRDAAIDFDVVSIPEFLKEGDAVSDCMKPSRIVIGVDNPRPVEPLKKLLAPFNRNHNKVIVMDTRSAELTKYAANAMLATKISFMNELTQVAEKFGADIENVRLGIGSDPRIGFQFIYPGCGYGGSCFPKDVRALRRSAESQDIEPQLLQAVEAVNDRQKKRLFEKIFDYFKGELDGKVFAVWGLAFKPNTDDMREAPSRVLMEQLWELGASVRAFDPQAMPTVQALYAEHEGLQLCDSPELALQNADALVIVTEWSDFRSPDFEVIKRELRQPVIFDGRNMFDPALVKGRGVDYVGMGR